MLEILIIYSHPNPRQSRLNQALLKAADELTTVTVRDLYSHYPDFDIDIKEEQRLLAAADIVVFQHPLYWYSCPALMKEWIDLVLQHGFAYGEAGDKLAGKRWLSAISTGGDAHSYSDAGSHNHEIDNFLLPFERTAKLCEMHYLPAFISHDARELDEQAIQRQAQAYQQHLMSLSDQAQNLSKISGE
ncbi:MAG: NAD(P)H-dependent oxidoreductase [Pseudomonadales bacterium]|nr:NAD(P)H-dependent oxidoreductase [Pseudomonadales bacterium]